MSTPWPTMLFGMLRLLLLFAAIIGVVGDADAAHPSMPALFSDGAAIKVTTVGVPLDVDDPQRTAVGKLRYRGGLELRSDDARFGGLSALDVSADGATVTALSDRGYWIRLHPLYAEGRLVGAENARLGSLLDRSRPPEPGEADAESLAPLPDGGMIIAFEQDHRLMRYPRFGGGAGGGGGVERLAVPADVAQMPANGGIEALTRLNDGRLLMLGEDLNAGEGVRGWLRSADAAWSRLVYVTDSGFRPTGAATLPDGDVIVVERRVPPLDARLRRIPAGAITAGADLRGTVIAHLGNGITVDNMEGIAIRRDRDDRTLVYLVSDDNYLIFQRTLMLMFELVD